MNPAGGHLGRKRRAPEELEGACKILRMEEQLERDVGIEEVIVLEVLSECVGGNMNEELHEYGDGNVSEELNEFKEGDLVEENDDGEHVSEELADYEECEYAYETEYEEEYQGEECGEDEHVNQSEYEEIQRERERRDLLEQVEKEKCLAEMRRQKCICLEVILEKQAQELAELRDKCGENKVEMKISRPLKFDENLELNHNIEQIKVLGKGGNGIAHLVCFDGKTAVQKTALRGKINQQEIAIMHHLNGAGGAPLILAASDTSLVCDYVGDMTLENVMRGPVLPPRAIIHMLFSVAHRVKEMHQKAISHNDLKQDNVVFNSHTGNCHLIDFGLSCFFNEQISPVSNPFEYDRCYWIAPEVRLGLPATTASDMFSLGVMFDKLMHRQYIDDKDLVEICRRAKGIDAFRRPNIDELLSVLTKHI